MDWIQSQFESLTKYDIARYEPLLWWSFAISLALIVLTPVAVAWVVVQLPKDYFTAELRPQSRWPERRQELHASIVLAKNFLGGVLVLAGIAMFVLPGQGLLTLLAGLMLLNFPGKYRLERRLATQRHVWRSINWLRTRFGREPLERP
jgi:Putative transmembrane protein (PGPGW)